MHTKVCKENIKNSILNKILLAKHNRRIPSSGNRRLPLVEVDELICRPPGNIADRRTCRTNKQSEQVKINFFKLNAFIYHIVISENLLYWCTYDSMFQIEMRGGYCIHLSSFVLANNIQYTMINATIKKVKRVFLIFLLTRLVAKHPTHFHSSCCSQAKSARLPSLGSPTAYPALEADRRLPGLPSGEAPPAQAQPRQSGGNPMNRRSLDETTGKIINGG